MRLIKNYTFGIGTKIPYAKWPELVHQFLDAQGLTSRTFLYYFDDFPEGDEPIVEQMNTCACAKIRKDAPSLEEVRFYNRKKEGTSGYFFLSNIDASVLDSDAVILPLMNKIHRRYRFASSDLYYFDIDFFGKKTSFERDFSYCERNGFPIDPTRCLDLQPYGSGIRLHRDVCGDNELVLSVDMLHDGEVFDPAPYAQALHRLLPNIKYKEWLCVYLTEEEERNIEKIDAEAMPILEQCRNYFEEHFDREIVQNEYSAQYALATPLKCMAKQYGYEYRHLYRSCVFSLQKRTQRGHIIYVEVVTDPSRYSLGSFVSFCGIGYQHELGRNCRMPRDQNEADCCLSELMEVLAEFERTLLPKLDRFYPETPDWFII
jgi:hypothetical protein